MVNESYMHNVPRGSETHFKVMVVSEAFAGLNRLARHRAVNKWAKFEFRDICDKEFQVLDGFTHLKR